MNSKESINGCDDKELSLLVLLLVEVKLFCGPTIISSSAQHKDVQSPEGMRFSDFSLIFQAAIKFLCVCPRLLT